jgi:hypothetical protein
MHFSRSLGQALTSGAGGWVYTCPGGQGACAQSRQPSLPARLHTRPHMITYQQNKPWWQNTWLVALTVAGGVGAGAWWWSASPLQAQSAGATVDGHAPAAARKLALPDAALLVTPKLMDDGRPSDFSPEDWAALKEAMSKTPNPAAELERVVKYLRFQKGFEQWQSLQGSADTAKRRQLAQILLDQVPERLQQSEVTFSEAQMLQLALVADLEPNEGLRKQRLEALQDQLKAAAPQLDAQQQAHDAELEHEYKRREAAILADYQSRPEAQRNHDKFEQDLDAARRAVWGGKK